jgi:HK97 gp10 family phage protein
MLKLNVTGTLAKFGWSKIPDAIVQDILLTVTKQAYVTAVKNAPIDPNDPPIHIKDELTWTYNKDAKLGTVYVKLPYANAAEYGTKSRLPHPFMRPASKAAQNKMRSMIRLATKEAIDKGGK